MREQPNKLHQPAVSYNMLMVRNSSAFLVGLIVLLPYTLAQSPLYGQCGGMNWTGATTCVAGSVCTYSNPYYSQCLPGTASSTPATTSTAPSSTSTSNAKANYWFSFGDSYTQTGFSTTGALPSTSNPIGNPAFPGNTDTPGANWVDFVTATYNKSLVFTYNYAYGGATIDASLVAPYSTSVQTLTNQVNSFLNTVASKPASTPWTSDNALFSVFIGINDIGGSYGNSGDRSAFSDTLLNAYFALVQKLYNVGGRNFLFVNVPPVDRSPLMLSQSTANQALEKSVITTFNTKLLAKVSAFQSANSGVKTFFWDSNAQFTTILNSPTTYGFKDATSYGTASNQFWGNNYHPSTYAHKFFGQTVGQTVLANTIW